jgi:hypothetical protein
MYAYHSKKKDYDYLFSGIGYMENGLILHWDCMGGKVDE